MPEIPQARFRPRFAARKIEDLAHFGGELLHPHVLDSTSMDTRYENLPLRQEVILPVGEFLNRLVVRGTDNTYIGQTASREDVLTLLDPAMEAEGMVLAPDTKNMVYHQKHQSYQPMGSGSASDGGTLRSATSSTSTTAYTSNGGLPLYGVYNRNIGTAPTITPAVSWGNGSDLKSAARNRFMSLWMTGGRDASVQMTSPKYAIRPWTSATVSTQADWEKHAETFALLQMHSSALSFVYQFRKELQKLASKTQYLSQELVGFIEKGMKGDFLRDQTPLETWLTISMVEFGKAYRTQRWSRNVHPSSTTVAGLADTGLCDSSTTGVVSPFFVSLSHGTYGERSFMPYWVAPLIDREHFEYDETIDDVRDIHREDLFVGLKLLLEAASYEYGMAWKCVGNPYLDFFEGMDEAKIPDLTDMASIEAMRSMQMVGFTSMAQHHDMAVPSESMKKWAFFDNLFSDGTISQSARLNLQQDLAQLDSLPCLTGSKFKEGMQMVGPFENTEFHRATRFGEHTIDVEYRPWVLIRPQRFESQSDDYSSGTQKSYKRWMLTSTVQDFSPSTVLEGGLYNHVASDGSVPTGLAGLLADTDTATVTKVQDHAKYSANVTTDWISFPSVDKGWDTFAKGTYHKNHSPVLGYGNLVIGDVTTETSVAQANTPAWTAPYVVDWGGALGNTYAPLIAGGTELCPPEYWSVGYEGIFTSMVPLFNKVYRAWQGRTDGLFRRSELKNLLSFTAVNLHREMKMNTPEAFFSKFGREITLSMTCASHPYDPGLLVRHTNRNLTNGGYHMRNDDTRFLLSPFVVEPSGIEDVFAAQHLLGFMMGQYGPSFLKEDSALLPNGGLYSGGMASDASGTAMNNILRDELRASVNFNPAVNEQPFFPLLRGAGAWPYLNNSLAGAGFDADKVSTGFGFGDPVFRWFSPIRGNTIRTFYQTFKAVDGAETYIGCTPMGEWLGNSPLFQGNVWYSHQTKIYNMLTETVHSYGLVGTDSSATPVQPVTSLVAGLTWSATEQAFVTGATGWSIGSGCTTETMAGHRNLFEIWRLDGRQDLIDRHLALGYHGFAISSPGTHAPVTTVPSLCTGFGLTSTASAGGASTGVDALETFRGPVDILVAGLSGVSKQNDIDGSVGGFSYDVGSASSYSDATEFNQAWLDYIEGRSGGINGTPADLVIWRRAAPQLLVYDEDLLDTDEGMLGALMWLGHRVSHPGQITYLAVLNPDGTLGYEIRGQYSWGSGATVSESAETPTGTEDIPDYQA